jgi:hypothetical protein
VTTTEYAAAQERYRRANDALRAHMDAGEPIYAEAKAAGAELIRLDALARPLREFLLDRLTRYTWSRPPTGKRLAKMAYRTEAEVRDALSALVAEGLVVVTGVGGYEAATG